jgi:hypothetical protein
LPLGTEDPEPGRVILGCCKFHPRIHTQMPSNESTRREHQPCTVVHTCNPSTGEAEAGGLKVQGQSGLHRQFESGPVYIVRPCLKQTKKEENPPQTACWPQHLSFNDASLWASHSHIHVTHTSNTHILHTHHTHNITLPEQGYTHRTGISKSDPPSLPKKGPGTALDSSWTHPLLCASLNGVPSAQYQEPSLPLSVRPIQ